MTIRIVEAPGIEHDQLFSIRDRANAYTRRTLEPNGARVRENKTYWYVVQEKVREYPFGTYTDMHYNTFAKREDAEEYASWHKDQ